MTAPYCSATEDSIVTAFDASDIDSIVRKKAVPWHSAAFKPETIFVREGSFDFERAAEVQQHDFAFWEPSSRGL